MDIDKLQKVNALAREYVKHGMAKSMDEAVRMADEKFKDSFGEKLPQTDTSHGPVQPAKPREEVEAPAEQVLAQPDAAPEQKSLGLKQTAVPDEVAKKVDAHGEQIEMISNKMNEMIRELNELSEKVAKLSRPTAPPASVNKDVPEVQTQFKPQPKPAEEKKNHARTGSYTPDDVSVEKFFYSGTGGPKE